MRAFLFMGYEPLIHMLETQASDHYDYEVARMFYEQGRWTAALNKQLVAQVRSADTREDYDTYKSNHLRTEGRSHAPASPRMEEAPGTEAGATALEREQSDELG